MNGFDLSNRVVVITGGANGIGAATARSCAEAGATVAILDIAEEMGEALAAEHEAITFHKVDISDQNAVHRAVQGVIDVHGRVDGLVCAAIVQPLMSVLEIKPENFSRVMDINLGGVVWSSQAVLPTMIEQGSGSIVVFVSGTADLGKPGSSPYTASKGAVGGFAKTLAREVAADGVRVNLCRPGIIDTPQFRAANPNADYSKLDRPEDVVGPVMFLLSDFATMTGSLVSREMSIPHREAVKR